MLLEFKDKHIFTKTDMLKHHDNFAFCVEVADNDNVVVVTF